VILETYTARGKEPDLARRNLVRRLAEIFQRVTGKRPSRSHNSASGLDAGPFLDFVRAILKDIDPDGRKGVEHVIREIIKSVK